MPSRLRPRSRGQALVEFALILPVFLLFLLVSIDFGRLFFTYVQTTNAAREGANFAASAPTDTASISSRVAMEKNAQGQRSEGATTLAAPVCRDPIGTVIPCAVATGGPGAGNTVTVAVDTPFTFLTPLVNNFFGGSLTVSSSATAAVLGYVPGASATQPANCSSPPAARFAIIVTSGLTILADPTGSTPNSGVCNISGYNWDWGDGQSSVGTATGDIHTYDSPGTYTVVLEVTNQGGSSSASATAIVPAAAPTPTPTPTATTDPTPTPTATVDPTPTPTPVVCTRPNANFTWTITGNGSNRVYTYRDASTVANAASCPITDWLWTFTDVGTPPLQSNAQNPAPVTYGGNPNATHPVTLRVTNAAGFAEVTKR